MGATLSSFATVKHLVSANSKKIGGMRSIRDILLKSLADKLKTYHMLCKEVYSRPILHAKKQRAVEIPHRSSSCLHQSRDEGQIRRIASLFSNRNPFADPRAIKHVTDSAS